MICWMFHLFDILLFTQIVPFLLSRFNAVGLFWQIPGEFRYSRKGWRTSIAVESYKLSRANAAYGFYNVQSRMMSSQNLKKIFANEVYRIL